MNQTKNDGYYLQKIQTDLLFIQKHTQNLAKETLESNEILVDSMLFRLIQVAENTNKLSERIKTRNPTIPWRAMKGLRNRIVHDYGKVDLGIIFDTITQDVPQLCEQIATLLEEMDASGSR